jgi:hypothetical protein
MNKQRGRIRDNTTALDGEGIGEDKRANTIFRKACKSGHPPILD